MLKNERRTLFRTIRIGIGTSEVGFYSGGERLGSTPEITKKNGNLEPRSRVGVSGWKMAKRKHHKEWEFWKTDLRGFLQKTSHHDQTSPRGGGVGLAVEDEEPD